LVFGAPQHCRLCRFWVEELVIGAIVQCNLKKISTKLLTLSTNLLL